MRIIFSLFHEFNGVVVYFEDINSVGKVACGNWCSVPVVDAGNHHSANVVDCGFGRVSCLPSVNAQLVVAVVRFHTARRGFKNAEQTAKQFAENSDSKLGKILDAGQGQFTITDRDGNTPYIKKLRVVSTVTYSLKD